jgi:hypothetical protein
MDYSDDEFISAVEACAIESFHHSDHIRLARLYCERWGLPEGSRRIVETIQRLAAHGGQPDKYHHTMTLAWMRVVDAARQGPGADLLDKNALRNYYSAAVLSSDMARRGWVEPDLAPLP